jgi:PBP1b-binding outer membrane lipoprotein LpoB
MQTLKRSCRTGRRWLLICAAGLTVAAGSGCSTSETKRVDPDALTEMETGTGLSSQDFRSICERMARSLITRPEIQNASTPPKVALYRVQNNSNDYIEGDAFTRKMRTLLSKHCEGKIVFIDRELTEAIEKEQRDKRRGKVTSAGDADRLGADFFLTGELDAIDRSAGGGMTTYYRFSFRLTNAGTSAIVWEDEYETKKAPKRGDVYR